MKTQYKMIWLSMLVLAGACDLGSGPPTEIGPASPSSSVISVSPTQIKADGIATAEIRIQLRDHESSNLVQGGDAVELATDLGTLSPVVDNGNGTYNSTIKSTSQGTATITVSINGGFYDGTPPRVTFLP
jgi:adhesin/invasin